MTYLQVQQENKKLITQISRKIILKTTKVCLGAELCCAVASAESKENMDIDKIQIAINAGDKAIMNLMDELTDCVKVMSEEYRNCLRKQMEITKRSQNVGPLSESWDELPKYRTLADELQQQLNNFSALFETLGKMVESKLTDYTAKDTEIFSNINKKFRESQELIRKEYEENRILEIKLLRLNCDTILMDIVGISETD